jgi:hypothetical protein
MKPHAPFAAIAATAWLAASAAPAMAAAPANDDFEHAQPLGDVPAHATGTRAEATRQTGEPAHGSQTVWYTVAPSRSGRVAVEVPRADTSTNLAVYTGSGFADLHAVGHTEGSIPARVAFDAVAGSTYRVAVATTYETTSDAFEVQTREAPLPANDAFEDAQRVTIPGVYEGNLADATGELGEPDGGTHSLWYRIKPRRTGKLTIEAAGDANPNLSVYTGSDVAGLHEVRGSGGGVIRFVAKRKRTYRIRVTSDFPGLGDVSLTVSDGSVAGKGLTVSAPAGQSVESVRSRGLRLVVGARRKVRISLALVVTRQTARRLGLKGTELGRAKGTLGYHDERPAAIRLTGAARRALSGETGLTAKVRATILHSDAPNRVLTVPVRLPN